ncbi:histidinol-phosphate transaminase [Aureibaculum sp. 2210JD6-5]|uniref:histidinol-phosphate transaminase n=1 Tax=Aureibaculum sp. 2210JD6-5 TaxID=3103957 RepID=UPI002AAE0580|nr:histidinol-phosphate transaminase [Aureibaculum sp. 2210JD6-5]MDY7396373.1 histidinol-phosphate transaminase [Aureibaculum sp. 2210JD6-5]
MIDFNLNSLIRENVKALKPYSSARDEFKGFKQDMVFLDANENPIFNGVNRYPDPQQTSVKRVLSEQKDVAIENILLGNGSDEVLDLIYRAFCEPNVDNVITMPPTYGMYSVLAGINNVENREVLLTKFFQPDVDAILEQIDKHTKLLFICSPNNPTGNAFNATLIEEILVNFKGLVIIDEAYIDFSSKESWLNKLENYPNLIVTQTLSKAFGLAGIRLGICYASTEIIAVLNKIKPPYNVNELTQQRALKRLINIGIVQNEINTILSQKHKLLKLLPEIEFIEEIYPTDGNFILVKVDDADKRYNQLLEKGIVVRNRTNQPLCENCLRFTIGANNENKRLIKALNEI